LISGGEGGIDSPSGRDPAPLSAHHDMIPDCGPIALFSGGEGGIVSPAARDPGATLRLMSIIPEAGRSH